MNKKIMAMMGGILGLAIIASLYFAFFSHKEIDINSIDTSKLSLSAQQVELYRSKYIEFSNKLNVDIEDYEKSKTDNNRPDQDYFIEKARYAEYLGQHDQAIWTLNQLLRYYDNSSIAWNNLAAIYESQGDFKKAIKYYEKIVSTFGEQASGKYYLQIAQNYLRLGNKEKAKESYANFKKWSTDKDPQLEELLKS